MAVLDATPTAITPDPPTAHLRRHRSSRPTGADIGAAGAFTQVTAIAHRSGTGSLGEPVEVVALKVGGSSPLGQAQVRALGL